jgi:hypothetical protein
MYYRINVAKGGKHFFATADHSLTSQMDYYKVLPVIAEKFPESEGYKISVSYWTHSGKHRDVTEDLETASKDWGFAS